MFAPMTVMRPSQLSLRQSRRALIAMKAMMEALRYPMVIRLALPPAAAVLMDVLTSSSSQWRQ